MPVGCPNDMEGEINLFSNVMDVLKLPALMLCMFSDLEKGPNVPSIMKWAFQMFLKYTVFSTY